MKKSHFYSIIIIFLFSMALLNYLDRQTLSIANTKISLAFDISPAEMGFLLSAFMWPYALASLPAGYMVDRYCINRVMIVSMLMWSVACILGGIVIGFYSILLTRLLLGMAEAPFFIVATKIIQQHFPVEKRGFVSSIVSLGPRMANILAPIILVGLMLLVDWRGMFIILGLIGLLMAYTWHKFNKKYQHKVKHGQQTFEKGDSFSNIKKVFTNRNVILLCIGNLCSSYAYWIFLTWLPYYFEKAKGLNLSEMGLATSASFIMSIIAVMLGGMVSDKLIKRSVHATTARLVPIITGCVVASISILLITTIENIYLTVILISISTFALGLRISPTWALVADISPKNMVGMIGGAQNFANFVGAGLSPLITGIILQTTNNNFTIVFMISSGICLFGAVIYMFIRSKNTI